MSGRGKFAMVCLAVLGLALLALGLTVGRDALTFWRHGFFERPDPIPYRGTSMDNLRAQHTALMLYHESEGQFPNSTHWMDAIENRLQTADLKPGEGAKKLVHPRFRAEPGKFGYAMNDDASAKFKDDIPEPDTTPLVFESISTERNAHGDPAELAARPGTALSVSGAALDLR